MTTIITMVASSAYLLMALTVSTGDSNILWVHYLDWLITTPMLLADLGSESAEEELEEPEK